MSDNSTLPIGWISQKSCECADFITKCSTPKTYGHSYKDHGIPFVRVEHLRNGWISSEKIKQFIDIEADETLKRSLLSSGDVLFSLAGTFGRTAIVRDCDVPANTNQAIGIIRNYELIWDGMFLRYVLESTSLQQAALQRRRGGAMNNISLEDLRSFELPIPPITTVALY